jgi:hypothetical protein
MGTQNIEESWEDLFQHCDSATKCWNRLHLYVNTGRSLLQFKDGLNVPFFMEIIILMSCRIWIVRNNIFNGIAPSTSCKAVFYKEFSLVLHRAKNSYFPAINTFPF